MDPGMLNAVGTVVLMAAFIGVCVWAYGPSRRARFEADACLPFLEDDHERNAR